VQIEPDNHLYYVITVMLSGSRILVPDAKITRESQLPTSTQTERLCSARLPQQTKRVSNGLWCLSEADCQFCYFDDHIWRGAAAVRLHHSPMLKDRFRKVDQLITLFKGQPPFHPHGPFEQGNPLSPVFHTRIERNYHADPFENKMRAHREGASRLS
jgi:hypothetical protein